MAFIIQMHKRILFLVFFCVPIHALSIIRVDPSGTADYGTIQGAINSVPANNMAWIQIQVTAGSYVEQVIIPRDKPFLYLKGLGAESTKVVWSGHGEDTIDTQGTFISLADNILVQGITIANAFNYPPEDNKNPRKQAVAAKISGDKSAFYSVTFIGVQDTLYDHSGRHYFHWCTIIGAVDFIFGAGQSIYESCTISPIVGASIDVSKACITAQGRLTAGDTNGFVFKDSSITGEGPTLLGRAWKEHARVFFIRTNMQDIVVHQGWDTWQKDVNDLTFGEYDCTGPGSNTSGRVSWETKVTPEMAEEFESLRYIDVEGWIAGQPRLSVDTVPTLSDRNATMGYTGKSVSLIGCRGIVLHSIFTFIILLIFNYS